MHIRVSESTDKEWEFSELRRAAKGNEFLGVPWRPEGCEANDKKSRILSTRQLKSQDAYLSPSEFTSWELPGVCAVLSRSASLQMSHFILRSMRSSLLQLHRRQLLKNCSCSDFWPSTPMQLWFQALFGIFNARILRLDDFFPSDHLDSAARISRSPAPNDLSCLSEIRHSNDLKNPPRGVQFYLAVYRKTSRTTLHRDRRALREALPPQHYVWSPARLARLL